MRVSCLQENLARGLATVSRAVATRSTLPVLSNIYLGTDKGRLKIVATNLEIGLSKWVGAQIEEEGETTVPARTFEDLVKQSPPERISLHLDSSANKLEYNCASISANIKGIEASEFPIIPTAESTEGQKIQVSADLLKEMINHVVFAAATDETRPVLTGVLVDFDDTELTMVAADGFRLSVRRAQLDTPVEESVRVIVPARALQELGRVLSDEDEFVDIIVTPNRNQILFHVEDLDLVSQLIEGNFPDYKMIIPDTTNTHITVDTGQLLKAVRRALIFARDAANIVRFNIEAGDELEGQLTVRAEAAEMGGGEEELMAAIEGPSMEIAFNGRYLVDLLGAMESNQIALHTSSSSSPGVFKPVGTDMDFTHVIMPMHIGNR